LKHTLDTRETAVIIRLESITGSTQIQKVHKSTKPNRKMAKNEAEITVDNFIHIRFETKALCKALIFSHPLPDCGQCFLLFKS
jgi:hypothetical protein